MIIRNRTKGEIELIVNAALEMWYLTSLQHNSRLDELDIQYLVKETKNTFEIKLSWVLDFVKSPISFDPVYQEYDEIDRDGKTIVIEKFQKIRKLIIEVINILEDLI